MDLGRGGYGWVGGWSWRGVNTGPAGVAAVAPLVIVNTGTWLEHFRRGRTAVDKRRLASPPFRRQDLEGFFVTCDGVMVSIFGSWSSSFST